MTYLLYAFLIFWLTAVFYTSVMHFKLIKDKEPEVWADMHWSSKGIGYLTLWVGLVLDLLLNVLVMTVVFVELPKELLTTGCVRRNKFNPSDKLLFGLITSKLMQAYRYKLALAFCQNYLTPFDREHCE